MSMPHPLNIPYKGENGDIMKVKADQLTSAMKVKA